MTQTAIVSGVIANRPYNGGMTWTRLSWALGLRQLGWRVVFVESIGSAACVGADGAVVPLDASVNLAYFREIMQEFGLSGSAALLCEDGEQVAGMTWPDLVDAAASADLLINISGNLTHPALLRRIRRKVYVDLDPGFTQFWQATGQAGARLDGHDAYYTVGENIGSPDCPIPTAGLDWRPIRQPVVLDRWPVAAATDPARFTTVASWRGPYGPVEYQGHTYGLKVHEFRKVLALPQHAPFTFEIALDIHTGDSKDLAQLHACGWRITDPKVVARGPGAFQRYIQQSGAEFSAAQAMYVETQSGWFSDRTVRYLASGKPVLVQDTGIGHRYPVGRGLLTFRSLDDAVRGAHEIQVDYAEHCRAARALAEAHFDSDRVLGRMLDELAV